MHYTLFDPILDRDSDEFPSTLGISMLFLAVSDFKSIFLEVSNSDFEFEFLRVSGFEFEFLEVSDFEFLEVSGSDFEFEFFSTCSIKAAIRLQNKKEVVRDGKLKLNCYSESRVEYGKGNMKKGEVRREVKEKMSH